MVPIRFALVLFAALALAGAAGAQVGEEKESAVVNGDLRSGERVVTYLEVVDTP